MFTGVYTAFITPFDADGKIDFTALTDLLDRQIEAGINGLVLLGATLTAGFRLLSAPERTPPPPPWNKSAWLKRIGRKGCWWSRLTTTNPIPPG